MRQPFSKLESKFTCMYTIILTIVITCLAVSIGLYSGSILKKKSMDSCMQKLSFVEERFQLILNRIESESLLLTLNHAARHESSRKENSSPYEEHSEAMSFASYLVEFLSTQNAVESISYYSKDGSFIYQDTYGSLPAVKVEIPVDVQTEFFNSPRKSSWYIQESPSFSTPKNLVFTCMKKAFAFTGEPLGFFALTIAPSQIQSIYTDFFSEHELFLISDKTGRICASTDQTLPGQMLDQLLSGPDLLQNGVTVTRGTTDYLCTSLSKNDLYFLVLTPKSFIYQEAVSLVSVILFIGFLSCGFTFFVFRYSTKKVMLPINHIVSSVRCISEGNYSVRIPVAEKNKDEISILARQINQMAKNTQELLLHVRHENELKRKYELSCLQLQVQPHFLYNTLETLCGMIELNDKKEAISLVNLISSFYRGTINKGKEIITIEQEMKITCDYLRIMQKRYPSCFDFEISVSPEICSCFIPKLTLQPLVENSIIHGLQQFTCGKHGLISIKGAMENSCIILEIKDNGNGMDEKMVSQLNSQIFTEETNSFGIQSIKQRLKLYFPTVEITIVSHIKEGTSVKIKFSSQLSSL